MLRALFFVSRMPVPACSRI